MNHEYRALSVLKQLLSKIEITTVVNKKLFFFSILPQFFSHGSICQWCLTSKMSLKDATVKSYKKACLPLKMYLVKSL